jgi:hypothetical protein
VAAPPILCDGYPAEEAAMFTSMPQAIMPEAIQSFFALAWGFAIAGFCASGYRLFASHLPSFRQLEVGPVLARFAAIPLLMFSAPYIIMRNTLRGRSIEKRRADLVMVATVIAGLWSLMSGTVVVLALQSFL